MCGISGFISDSHWKTRDDLSWLDDVIDEIAALQSNLHSGKDKPLNFKHLTERFNDLMSFNLYHEMVERQGIRQKVEQVQNALERLQKAFKQLVSVGKNTPQFDHLAEITRDYLWQVKWEVLGSIERTRILFPKSTPAEQNRSSHFLAWSVEQTLENIDRLEVRGRDSAGIVIQCLLPVNTDLNSLLSKPQQTELRKRKTIQHAGNGHVLTHDLDTGQSVCRFLFKTANLVGQLGDNSKCLRAFIQNDMLLWKIVANIDQINIVAHTRWASNGIISIPNCHPVDGNLDESDHHKNGIDKDVVFAVNGDVDNYQALLKETVTSRNLKLHPSTSTDAKILPLVHRFNTDARKLPEQRFMATMSQCKGSMAAVMQHPLYTDTLFLGQKGSGQSLFVGKVADGWIVASEVHGLASRTRQSYSLSGTEKGGNMVSVRVAENKDERLVAHFFAVNESVEIQPKPIEIYSRDIFRGSYEYYLEKEIQEAPESVRKTLQGKYVKKENQIEFSVHNFESLRDIVGRLRNPTLPQIRRVLVIGQGTASIAAMGVAYLIERAIRHAGVLVSWQKASEVSGFPNEETMDDLLLIAISQSGTTTDTNRTVDIIRSKGAWVHAIVNRRNSPLVSKSNSYLYTSDGRDVEMSVASTKAFYSQIAAGKLLAMLLAQEFRSMKEDQIYQEITELEKLPDKIAEVLALNDTIAAMAEKYAPSSRNWAVVGNGPNKIAAEEIRIKLSELCYKSIPCDYTEDKKHIDLSTEPLTIVVANELPEEIVQDTVKETAIFKAHNGKPLVFCVRGEKRFNEYAEQVIELPPIKADLGFVLATVAGHLWGFHAAKAIDRRGITLYEIRSLLTDLLDESANPDRKTLTAEIDAFQKLASSGEFDTSLPTSIAANLFQYFAKLNGDLNNSSPSKGIFKEGIEILTKAIEEIKRPIDSIRHQAKTITVGISRPQQVLPSIWINAFKELSVGVEQTRESDRDLLRTLSPVLEQLEGGMRYRIANEVWTEFGTDMPEIQITQRFGCSVGVPSMYDQPTKAIGFKRKALRLERVFWSSGRDGNENLVLIPLFGDDNICFGIAIYHLAFIDRASIQQKVNILHGIGKYDEFIEYLEETSNISRINEILENTSPRDLIFVPVHSFVTT